MISRISTGSKRILESIRRWKEDCVVRASVQGETTDPAWKMKGKPRSITFVGTKKNRFGSIVFVEIESDKDNSRHKVAGRDDLRVTSWKKKYLESLPISVKQALSALKC